MTRALYDLSDLTVVLQCARCGKGVGLWSVAGLRQVVVETQRSKSRAQRISLPDGVCPRCGNDNSGSSLLMAVQHGLGLDLPKVTGEHPLDIAPQAPQNGFAEPAPYLVVSNLRPVGFVWRRLNYGVANKVCGDDGFMYAQAAQQPYLFYVRPAPLETLVVRKMWEALNTLDFD